MDPPSSSSTRNSRPRLLYNLGTSFLTISHNALRALALFIVGPIVGSLELQWLWILSFLDDRILDIEDVTMFLFPRSERLFSALDDLAILVESLPKILEDAIDRLSSLLKEVPLFEKDIVVVDTKCDEKKKTEKDNDDDAAEVEYAYKENLQESSEKNEIVEERETTTKVQRGVEEATAPEKNEIVEEIRETQVQKSGVVQKKRKGKAAEKTVEVAILGLLDEGWGMGLRTKTGKK